MKGYKRDIILLRRETFPSQRSIELEVKLLNSMLQAIENSEKMICTFELIDLNRFRVISQSHLLSRSIKATTQKPFEFLINKN
jgi:hypothetical protein